MILELVDLSCEVAIVTGSTRGLGELAAIAPTRTGADVVGMWPQYC